MLIAELAKSGTFKTTRSILKSLAKYGDFTDSQISEIAEAATNNNQVYWIGDDTDIKTLMGKLIGGSLDTLSEDTRGRYDEYFNKPAKATAKGDETKCDEEEEKEEDDDGPSL